MQFGKGLFETVLVVGGRPVFLEAHISRLNNSLKDLNGFQSVSLELFKAHFELRMALSSCSPKAVLKFSVYLGNNALYWHISITEDRYPQGVPWPLRLELSPNLQSAKNPLNTHKTMNYWSRSLDLTRTSDKLIDEVIYCDEHGNVLEGSKGNIFILKDNVWFTPDAHSGILVGIARDWFIQCLKERGELFREQSIALSDLIASDVIVLTNSLIGLSIGTLENHANPEKAPLLKDHLAWLKSLQLAYRGGHYGQI